MHATIGTVVPAERKSAAFFVKQEKIYPKAVSGKYRNIKWGVMLALLAIYYALPWLRWDRGSGIPDQAVLFDFDNQRFYVFMIELWPQQIYYLTGALILAAVGLFLATALAGRVWCGYACPQTVWTDLFVSVERWFEGDRNARMRRDRGPWRFDKLWRKAATHAVWLLISVATGGAFILYFVDAPGFAAGLARLEASSAALWFAAIFTFTTYTLAGFLREHVCIYMCPWPRFQGAMLDEESLIVTYREGRGEGRAHLDRGQSWTARAAAGLGDCIDCKACHHACPTGVDIRNGMQADCIGCGLCIDACDDVMDRIGRPRGLVAFDTAANAQSLAASGQKAPYRLLRPRTIVYGLLLVVVAGAIAAGLLLRPGLQVSILRDRAPLYVTLADGAVSNAYTVKISNMTRRARDYAVTAAGVAGLELRLAGSSREAVAAGPLRLAAAPDAVAAYRILAVADPAGVAGASTPLRFTLAAADGETAVYETVFLAPSSR